MAKNVNNVLPENRGQTYSVRPVCQSREEIISYRNTMFYKYGF